MFFIGPRLGVDREIVSVQQSSTQNVEAEVVVPKDESPTLQIPFAQKIVIQQGIVTISQERVVKSEEESFRDDLLAVVNYKEFGEVPVLDATLVCLTDCLRTCIKLALEEGRHNIPKIKILSQILKAIYKFYKIPSKENKKELLSILFKDRDLCKGIFAPFSKILFKSDVMLQRSVNDVLGEKTEVLRTMLTGAEIPDKLVLFVRTKYEALSAPIFFIESLKRSLEVAALEDAEIRCDRCFKLANERIDNIAGQIRSFQNELTMIPSGYNRRMILWLPTINSHARFVYSRVITCVKVLQNLTAEKELLDLFLDILSDFLAVYDLFLDKNVSVVDLTEATSAEQADFEEDIEESLQVKKSPKTVDREEVSSGEGVLDSKESDEIYVETEAEKDPEKLSVKQQLIQETELRFDSVLETGFIVQKPIFSLSRLLTRSLSFTDPHRRKAFIAHKDAIFNLQLAAQLLDLLCGSIHSHNIIYLSAIIPLLLSGLYTASEQMLKATYGEDDSFSHSILNHPEFCTKLKELNLFNSALSLDKAMLFSRFLFSMINAKEHINQQAALMRNVIILSDKIFSGDKGFTLGDLEVYKESVSQVMQLFCDGVKIFLEAYSSEDIEAKKDLAYFETRFTILRDQVLKELSSKNYLKRCNANLATFLENSLVKECQSVTRALSSKATGFKHLSEDAKQHFMRYTILFVAISTLCNGEESYIQGLATANRLFHAQLILELLFKLRFCKEGGSIIFYTRDFKVYEEIHKTTESYDESTDTHLLRDDVVELNTRTLSYYPHRIEFISQASSEKNLLGVIDAVIKFSLDKGFRVENARYLEIDARSYTKETHRCFQILRRVVKQVLDY